MNFWWVDLLKNWSKILAKSYEARIWGVWVWSPRFLSHNIFPPRKKFVVLESQWKTIISSPRLIHRKSWHTTWKIALRILLILWWIPSIYLMTTQMSMANCLKEAEREKTLRKGLLHQRRRRRRLHSFWTKTKYL